MLAMHATVTNHNPHYSHTCASRWFCQILNIVDNVHIQSKLYLIF